MRIRYEIAPQMRDYDNIGHVWTPFLMFFHKPDYISSVLNTDSYGFRFSHSKSGQYGLVNPIEKKALLVGGSYVFGVGATHDKYTLSSIMNNLTNYSWVNFGARSFTSTQELLLFQFFHRKKDNIKKIVIVSGMNNLILHHMTNSLSEIGTFFFESQFNEKMNTVMSKKRKLAKTILYPIFKNNIDYAQTSLREMLKYIYNKPKQSKILPSSVFDIKNNVLQILARDIFNWRLLSKALDIELHYVLQPFAHWIKKEKSIEEIELFNILDKQQPAFAKLTQQSFGEDMHEWFSKELSKICIQNDISYLDLNQELSAMSLDKEWLFVDRVHMTDKGNQMVAKILRDSLFLNETYRCSTPSPVV